MIESEQRSRNEMIERGSSGDSASTILFKEKRKLNYSDVMVENYLKFAPEDNPAMREKLQEFIKTGKVFDLSKEYMLHLLSRSNEQGS
mmetsp:Transcript_3854/g.3223  ORF Transcript_3854/g.3223 Transcript_3854/m.3223 type:complete len:88 (-) Transcript_3854:84-347(-)